MKKFTLYALQTFTLLLYFSITGISQISIENFKNVKIENTEINSDRLDFSPTFYQNGLVFISSRAEFGSRDEKIDETFFKMYYAPFDSYGNPHDVQVFSVELDSPFHEGPVSFNEKGDVMYFTQNSQENGFSKASTSGNVKLQIYKARKTEFGWTDVESLSFNSLNYSVVHPSLSKDGNYLFFASDMPGGFGGMDIYYSKRLAEGIWSKPNNLGKSINSASQEVFPNIHASGKLFFTSDRKGGFGGLDVYMSEGEFDEWGKALNLGSTINSAQDDLGLILNDAGTEGFFTSSRAGGLGKDDIYNVKLEGNRFAQSGKVSTKIKVFDYASNQLMPDVRVRIFEKVNTRIYKGNQYYDAVLVPATSNSNELAVKVISSKNRNVIIPDMLSNLNGEIQFEHDVNKEYVLEFYKDGYQTEEITYVKPTRSGNANLMIQMIQANQYAEIRSVLRNNQTGLPIANAKVIVEGCGEIQELVTDNYGAYTYKMSQSGCDYKLDFYKQGFYSGKVVVHDVDEARTIEVGIDAVTIHQKHVANNNTATLQSGTVVVLNNIYYDYGKSSVRVGNSSELDLIANMLRKYPDMQVELISHTDSRGSSAQNQLLSLKRSESVKEYLIKQGISRNRMIAIGYGEEVPRNNCIDGVNCSEQEYKFNRRTEVKVTKMRQPVAIHYNSDMFYNK